MSSRRDPGSFRDPCGFVFSRDGVLYRQVNEVYRDQYRAVIGSGLYDELARDRLLVAHEDVGLGFAESASAIAVLRPQRIPFISYPYEWCFSQLKAAALLTLHIQKRALARDLILRDASAYNVQFVGTHPIFIDTLSFGSYLEGQPWSAYRQFCQHFLAPLAMIAAHPALASLLQNNVDGIPLDLATSVLPFRTKLMPGLAIHLHLHGRSKAKAVANGNSHARSARMSRTAVLGLVDSLERTITDLNWKPADTLWSTYSTHMNYSETAQQHKQKLVEQMLMTASRTAPLQTVWDLGANTGIYSRLARQSATQVISFDNDPAVVEQHFRILRHQQIDKVLPLLQNIASPSPPLGWNNNERRSFGERGPADLAMALAVVHHLAIGSNVPLPNVAEFLAGLCRFLIVEFVPKNDSQVQRMLSLREDVFVDYSKDGFERAFGERFAILRSSEIEGTVRTLYLMEQR